MRTIAHISDLHFGRIDPVIADALAEDLRREPPGVLVISGDFTQRARRRQYEDAAAYLRRLPTPQIVVPGNHDVPLWDVSRRVFSPLGRYRRHISRNLFPEFEDPELFVLGVNTSRSFTRLSGWLVEKQLRFISDRMNAIPPGVFRVLVTHHPLIPPPGREHSNILLRGAWALERLERCGIDLLLAGHLHLAYHDDVRTHHESARRSILSVQAGTATSTRLRGEPNAYNWITLHDKNSLSIEVRTWTGQHFAPSLLTRWQRTNGQWQRTPSTGSGQAPPTDSGESPQPSGKNPSELQAHASN
ncbi:MAG TPA: metallophosphoesterase [Tepidisphaeraceae bacterium]|jgi:3',5'-cyclic AMP phosphodiesterase CpdA|nr:metallophosphoesterase [Tepidisphaeraceae bacterium]